MSFCLYISLKFRIFAISFQQLPHSVIDWGTIKNILLSDENNARNIYNTLLVSSFVYNQALLAFISRRLWCSLRHLTLAFCSQLFWHTIHNSLQFGITDGFAGQKAKGRAAAGIMELRIYGIADRAKPGQSSFYRENNPKIAKNTKILSATQKVMRQPLVVL